MNFISQIAIGTLSFAGITISVSFIDSYPFWALLILIALAIIVLSRIKKKRKLHDFRSGFGRIK